jgi:hypothetical protein
LKFGGRVSLWILTFDLTSVYSHCSVTAKAVSLDAAVQTLLL